MSTADADFSCLNFSYGLGVGLFVFLWGFKVWAGLFLPIQLCLLVVFLEQCKCRGILEGALKGADFSAGGFLLDKLEVLDLEAGQGCGMLGFACQRGLLLLAPCCSATAGLSPGEIQEPSSKLMKNPRSEFLCQTATHVPITCVQMP